MDFKDQVLQLGGRVEKLTPQIATEEATKNALIMPFIQLLGYDVFNPFEVNPEFVADLGIKKGEKVDYAIMKEGEPIILIECKHHLENLEPHNSQLFRYFHCTKAKFSILTNGIHFKFYTDLVEANKMDEKPFFEFNIAEIKETQIEELKKFHKSYFNIENIFNTASELKYMNQLKSLISVEFLNPSETLVRHFAKQVYPSIVTPKILDQFTQLTRKSITQHINDLITDRFKSAIKNEEKEMNGENTPSIIPPNEEGKIVTTEEELEAFFIVKSIVRSKIGSHRIVHRDAQSYFAILLDDNNRKPICRLYFNGKKKYITTFNEERKEIKSEIGSLDDIYNYSDLILKSIDVYSKN
ncbi:type I restriction endonuclease [Solitalea lacus]|uniref:type I restriction endonuclease n=1 Tax=Solitalea lacus TaxID=2911172 RepID=UPI001EDBACC6|nr:type I restriction endonuclease [Solitalea lacus]UKJ07004.1 type I restriction enzyme HsdR N-terminal domain-containing protein [Solitalea lacus]